MNACDPLPRLSSSWNISHLPPCFSQSSISDYGHDRASTQCIKMYSLNLRQKKRASWRSEIRALCLSRLAVRKTFSAPVRA